MSLINDLVLEVDRRRSASPAGRKDALEHLKPGPERSRRGDPRGRPRDLLRPALALLAMGSVAMGALLLRAPESGQRSGRLLPTTLERSSDRPAVSSRPGGERAAASSTPTADAGGTPEINRIRRISTEPVQSGTRIRIESEQTVEYEIRGAGLKRDIEIVLESSQLDEPIGPLELRRTGIRSFQTRSSGGALHLHLSLTEAAPVQGQWMLHNGKPSLVIDLASPAQVESAHEAPPARTHRGETRRSDDPQIHARSRRADASAGTRSASGMAIAPSQADRDRRRHEEERLEANRLLAEARSTASRGQTAEAIDLYRRALRTDPSEQQIGFELVELLLRLDLRQDALAHILDARRHAPDDPAWAMMHARALAESDLDAAIALLDGLDSDPRRDPEVHALAAAYAQRAGDHARALDRYEALLRQYPGSASLWMGMGISLEALERRTEAEDVYRIAIEVGGLPSASRSWVLGRVTALEDEG